jgi:hypothetical protein
VLGGSVLIVRGLHRFVTRDPGNTWQDACAVDHDGAVLVRPDR